MPIVELIAQAIETRLKAIRGTSLSSVYRPLQHDEETTEDRQAILCEISTERTGYIAGNPAAAEWLTVWHVKCQLANEANTKNIDRRKSEIRQAVHAAILKPSGYTGNDAYTLGGYAVGTEVDGPEVVVENGVVTVNVPVQVQYRTDYDDLTVQR